VAIFFWPYLLLVLVLAVLLGRWRRTPSGFLPWALLGLGLTQIDAWAALLVVGWFVAVDARARTPDIGNGWFDLRQLGLAFYSLVALGCLYAAVHVGLLLSPEMQVVGAAGSGSLSWYVDRVDGTMPRPAVISAPLWVYRLVMLAWALWLAFYLVKWARWGWGCMTTGGLWRPLLRQRAQTPPAAPSRAAPASPASSPSDPSSRGEGSEAGGPQPGAQGGEGSAPGPGVERATPAGSPDDGEGAGKKGES
jgi:hypothetical protein